MPFFHPHICSLANLETGDRNSFQGSHISPVQPGWLVLFSAVPLVIVSPSSFLAVLPVVKGKNSTVSTFFLGRLLRASDLLRILRCPCTQSHFWTPKSLSPCTCHSTYFFGKHYNSTPTLHPGSVYVIFTWEFVRKQPCCTLGDPVIFVLNF